MANYINLPEVGENWYVQLPGQSQLEHCQVQWVGTLAVKISIAGRGTSVWRIEDVNFIEQVPAHDPLANC